MTTAVLDDLLPQMVADLVRAVSPLRVILFGSHARGNAGPDSDLDLVVVSETVTDRRHETGDLLRLLARYPVPKDILLYSRTEFESGRDTRNHVLYDAVRQGKVLYES
jgi:predicted nucleotidyltransferase